MTREDMIEQLVTRFEKHGIPGECGDYNLRVLLAHESDVLLKQYLELSDWRFARSCKHAVELLAMLSARH